MTKHGGWQGAGTRPWHVIALAGLVRALLICWAEYQDKYLTVKYTDIDYVVFTDAARFVSRGGSPYRRATYRYSPLLAYLVLPNIWVHPAFGKVLFSAADLVAAAVLSYLLRRTAAPARIRTAALAAWLFNPYTATISTRGSCDVLSVLLLLALLVCLLHGRPLLSGALYGLAVHFRIYPVIYGPAIVLFLACRADLLTATATAAGREEGGEEGRRGIAAPKHVDRRSMDHTVAPAAAAADSPAEARRRLTIAAVEGRRETAGAASASQAAGRSTEDGGTGGDQEASRAARQRRPRRPAASPSAKRTLARTAAALRPVALFGAAAAATFLALGALFYSLYGDEFLREAFVHHLTRKDPRHNFSPYYYPVYLGYGSGGSAAAGASAVGGAAARATDPPLSLPPAARPADPGLDDAPQPAAGPSAALLGGAWDLARRAAAAVPLGEPWRLALLPQAAAVLAVALRFHEDLPVAWLLQTWCFVTLNKVVTAQYFVWYLSLLPLALPALAARAAAPWRRPLAVAAAGWVAAQLHWLWWAYQLEMQGRSVHLPLWAAGLLFQAANTAVVVLLIRALRRPRTPPSQPPLPMLPLRPAERDDASGSGGSAEDLSSPGSARGDEVGGSRSVGVDVAAAGADGGMSFLEASLALACPAPKAAIAAASKKQQ
ncbi:hypothetical protein GPECTOR_11g193 [Gonium pectorale]|uniref:GPI mannosyltransferase 1 n=1 Tax=Gonium pectorale TaxID=33097 RepID=A0A150GPJ1_GONPE|nr:hypothetical protein GPECTOR_11g193 [Gonium pectorale]|eukprot:KXZ51747.1 hypothetical protein GPECTOR_11g193 [Gonium pectorale]